VEAPGHVLIHQDLEVEPRVSIRANDNVGADASLERDVTTRKGKPTVRTVVDRGLADLLVGALEYPSDARGRLLRFCNQASTDEQQDQKSSEHRFVSL
jgi:hypothetical protein